MPAMRSAISMVQVPELKVRTGGRRSIPTSGFERLHFRAAGDPAGAQHVADGGDGGFIDGGFGKRQRAG
jgi:hypothetical protein